MFGMLVFSNGLFVDLNAAKLRFATLAEVNGRLWDMFRPLREDCELRFRFFTDPDLHQVNKVRMGVGGMWDLMVPEWWE